MTLSPHSSSMASPSQFLLLFSSFTSLFTQFHGSLLLILPVTKDPTTLQYLASFYYADNPLAPTKLVLDLGAPFTWAHCSSSSSRPIPSCSIQCSTARVHDLGTKNCFIGYTTCDLSTENTITRSTARGELSEAVLAVRSNPGSLITTVDQFLLSCAPSFLLSGLASGAQGMLGLGRTQIGLPSQLSSALGIHRKFVICLSSSNGFIAFGDVGTHDSIFGGQISKSLTYTPLVADNPDGASPEYSITVKSVKINGNKSPLDKISINGSTKISTIVPYTTMESSVYGKFVKAYAEAAMSMNMTRVAPVGPFGLCFSTSTAVAAVPAIDLVLQSEMVRWRIHRRNAVVAVSEEVMCLGVLDGGLNLKNPIVIGGFQMEETILEFDLGSSMLGFSSSLGQKSCSDYGLSESTSDN